MRNSYRSAKQIAGISVLLFIFPGCRIYQHNTISINKAISTNDTRFKKLKTTNRKVYHLRRIELIDGQLYGSKKKDEEMKPLFISPEEVKSVRLLAKQPSVGGTIMLSLGVGVVIVFAILLLTLMVPL